jgi:hypothetical protein
MPAYGVKGRGFETPHEQAFFAYEKSCPRVDFIKVGHRAQNIERTKNLRDNAKS